MRFGVALIVMGVAIAAIWTRDLVAAEKVDLSDGFLAARDEDGSLFWPHWIAEYGTAGLLLAGGIGLLADASWADVIAPVGAGALLYTSINSMAWALAAPDRYSYAIPMTVAAVVAIGAVVVLV